MDNEQKKKLLKEMAERKAEEAKLHAFSETTLTKLKEYDDTDEQAKFLANICVQLDERFGVGSQLTLEWFVDHYLGGEYFNNIAPKLEELYDMLVEDNHTCANPWSHFKGYAYYVPCKAANEYSSKKILVMTNENNENWKWLVIIDENTISENVFVRKIWKKTRLNCINDVDQPTLSFYRKINFDLCFDNDVYGDCRDIGHIMSYKSLKDINHDGGISTKVVGKCDHSLSFIADNIRWFMEVGFLHCEMIENNS